MMKKLVSAVLSAALLLICLVPHAFSVGETYIVSAEAGAWLYYLNSESSAKLALVRKDTLLTAQETSEGFIKTFYDGYVGWVLLSDLSSQEENDLWGLLIESPPDKTVYYEDDEFISDGLAVTAVYNDGRRENAAGFTVSAPDMHSVGKKNVVVAWGGKSAVFQIDVRRIPLDHIEITSLPEKTTLIEDSDYYDYTGLAVTAYYSDGRPPAPVTDFTLEGIDRNAVGKQNVTVFYKYEDISASFEIEVVPKKEINLRLTRIPDKTVYYENNLTPDLTGIELTVDYDNGKSALVRPDKAEFRQPISTTYKNTILVYYSRFMTEYYVDVFAEEPVRLALDLPAVTQFVVGTKLNEDALLGLRVYKVYNSGRKEETTDYIVDEIDTSVFGAQTINVYCGDLSAAFNVSIVSDAPLGDVNHDGKVNSVDARLTLRCAARLTEFTDEQISRGDVNADGKITTTDARIILRHASHIEFIEEKGA